MTVFALSPRGGKMPWRSPRNGRFAVAAVEFCRILFEPRDARRMTNHQYYVYMLTNRWHNVLYIGVTNSLEVRAWQHKAKAIPGFTKDYNRDQLVYFEIYERIEQAIAREKQLKG
jgi:putative endonuclease